MTDDRSEPMVDDGTMTKDPEARPAAPGAGGGAATPLLVAEQVTVRFGGIVALDGVSLEVDTDEVLGVIGPNGAGKTTLFDVLSGIRPPSSGRVLLEGGDISDRTPVWRARHGLRRTFQRQQVFGGLTVEDNVRAALDWRGGSGGAVSHLLGLPIGRAGQVARQERVDEVLVLCGLDSVRGVYAGALPIGLARVVELARAIVDPPTVLLLDEPSSGLGVAEAEILSRVIGEVRSSCAIALVEHDIGFVMEHCDRIVVLNLGTVLARGTPAQIAEDPVVREAYLG
jgi:branched-chain amino acid transport system ATP-binding protein